MELEGKVAVVTGGGGGIGRVLCAMLAERGADVVVVDRDADLAQTAAKEVELKGRKAIALATDITVKTQVRDMVGQAERALGGIDILVNGAAIFRFHTIVDYPEDVWDEMIAVNLKATFLCSQAVLPGMMERRRGRIVNIISKSAYRGRLNSGAYSAAKGGMLGFSRVLAVEAAPYGITVNNVAPGNVGTPRVLKRYEDMGIEEYAKGQGIITTPYRPAMPEEEAAAVLYFLGPYSDHVTGMTIHVNGGSFMP